MMDTHLRESHGFRSCPRCGEEKYNMVFPEFEAKIKGTTNKEIFEEWDDYILWESYVKALQYWSKMA